MIALVSHVPIFETKRMFNQDGFETGVIIYSEVCYQHALYSLRDCAARSPKPRIFRYLQVATTARRTPEILNGFLSRWLSSILSPPPHPKPKPFFPP